MKNSIILSLIIAFFSVVITNAQNKNKDHFTVKVDGLGCAFCAYGLEKKFQKLEGISHIKIDLEKGILDFDFIAEKGLTLSDVKYQVESSGYTPISGKVIRSNEKEEVVEFESSEKQSTKKNNQLWVNGNCEMCKERIEKATLSMNGVSKANWDLDSKLLTVEFNKSKTNLKDIELAISKVGHDTENYQAEDSTYSKLHSCCQYERK